METESLVSEIEACFPEIRIKKYHRIRMGWETVVLDVNDQYIFRFLNLQRRWPHQKAEIDLLKWLAPKITTTRVPNYEFVWLGSEDYPEKFAGYRKIQGLPATRTVFRSKHIDRLAKDFGRFATELHNIRQPGANLVPGYSRKSSLDWWATLHQQAKELAYPLLDLETQKKAERIWAEFIEDLAIADFTPRLIHSDSSHGNLIINASTGALNGVIDWGNTRMDDPARDFMGLFAMSPRLGKKALASYDLDKRGFRDRIRFYLLVEPFEDIVIGARESEERFRRRFVGEGMSALRERLGRTSH